MSEKYWLLRHDISGLLELNRQAVEIGEKRANILLRACCYQEVSLSFLLRYNWFISYARLGSMES